MEKTNYIIFIILIIIFAVLINNYFNPDKTRIEITSVQKIEIYEFDSFSKFSNNQIGVIYDEGKLSKFMIIINSLDTSEGIKKIDLPDNINLESFEYYFHIRPEFEYIEDDKIQKGSFLLHILIDNLEGKSYITFSGTELVYILDKKSTKILEEIFSM
ncbi:hypothetical protein Amet_0634 [Alkaliphilus metalliredigens QYMF]|uniref:Uncharacterized protein Clospo-01618-like domain-containing protein n=1 Tax=Alkaliphilus metalliredigens (strain QYMF) TaxID=293826 RepID=A6TKZ2_ALKMQ|nr:hypothetical protein [Alkaliphilus metalliredigens]ABR46860.1 hypothetical protein Amet_0634 [Alkaliphilus metalliredigens QYMF]